MSNQPDSDDPDGDEQPTVMGGPRPPAAPVTGDQPTILPGRTVVPDSGDQPTMLPGGAPRTAVPDSGDQPTVLPGGPKRTVVPDSGDQPTVLPPSSTATAAGAGEDKTVMSAGRPTAPADRSAGAYVRKPKMTFPPDSIVAERYRIVRFIAKGGMGEVYEAEDLHLRGEHVALKTVLPEIAEQENVLARFKREIQLARKVTHPNVCRIFDFGLHRGAPPEPGADPLEVSFLTMELLPGESMSAMLRREGKMTPAQALPLVTQIAAALGAAHRQGIVHRDFKSANVMLLKEPDGVRAVVTDFGLARREQSDGSLTGTGIVGTPDYMAPEQVEGGAISAATDVYALGVALYEMVSGRMPFTAESALSIAVKRLSQPPDPLRPHVPNLDPVWEAAIFKCMERRSADRYQTMDDVMRALTPAAGPAPRPPVDPGKQTELINKPPRPPRPDPPPPPPQPPRPLGLMVAGGLVLVAIIGGGAWWALKPDPVSPTPPPGTASPPPVVPADPNKLAVFEFQNTANEPSADWLRTALTDMLLSDLSGSTKVRVLGTGAVKEALKELGHQDTATPSADVIRKFSERTGVGKVMLGTFVQAGDNLRIEVKTQDPVTGEVLFSVKEEGAGQSQLFPMVGKLTAGLRRQLQAEPATAIDPYKGLDEFAGAAAYPVTVSTGQSTYKVGENLVVTVQIPRSGYLNLVNVGEGDKEAVLLFPNQYQPKNRFEAGSRVSIGGSGDPFKLPAGLPDGAAKQQTLVVAVLTQQPLNGYEMGLARAGFLSQLQGSDTGSFFAAARSGGEFGAGKQVVTITR